MDLLAELRNEADSMFRHPDIDGLVSRAADEIESLTDRLSFAEFEWHRATDAMKERDAVIERLREQLGKAVALREAAVRTVKENGHLADGENCTLIHLVRALAETDEIGEK